MEKEQILKALSELKQSQRKFLQNYDLIITFRDVDFKKSPIETFVALPHARGKKAAVCAFVGQELAEKAAQACDVVVRETNFDSYKGDAKKIKQLARTCTFFLAQANLMPQVATVFGRVLGPRNRMPNPKAGCVVPPNADLKALVERLQKTVHLKSRAMSMVQCIVGTEQMADEQIADNVLAVYQQVMKLLPSEENNIRAVHLKKTMSPAVKL